ncbi:hypothetical protein V496_09735 [Pseudogymnoascus sp. VKM F-4515 (FW-2607)]|nr:hypothetical protein V496_09735 [Pseudogymnoascus sp. VKM F-4515 (FW-2607)]KFY69445.1 hypothetical protein V498_10472 [Pseudogymnoascus sp. VKM F-4517 (FW-2822)]
MHSYTKDFGMKDASKQNMAVLNLHTEKAALEVRFRETAASNAGFCPWPKVAFASASLHILLTATAYRQQQLTDSKTYSQQQLTNSKTVLTPPAVVPAPKPAQCKEQRLFSSRRVHRCHLFFLVAISWKLNEEAEERWAGDLDI